MTQAESVPLPRFFDVRSPASKGESAQLCGDAAMVAAHVDLFTSMGVTPGADRVHSNPGASQAEPSQERRKAEELRVDTPTKQSSTASPVPGDSIE